MNLRCYFISGDNVPKERQPLHSKGKNTVKILTWLQGDWTMSIRVSYPSRKSASFFLSRKIIYNLLNFTLLLLS